MLQACGAWGAAFSRRNAATNSLVMARVTGLEPATSGVTGRRSNQLSYAPATADRAPSYLGTG